MSKMVIPYVLPPLHGRLMRHTAVLRGGRDLSLIGTNIKPQEQSPKGDCLGGGLVLVLCVPS